MIIRKANIDDVKDISKLHQFAFDKDYFTYMFSTKMLIRFYSTLISLNNYNYLAIDNENNALGFIIAGFKTKASINIFIKKNVLSLSFILLRHPKFLFKKIKTFFQRNSNNEFISRANLRLLSIAVNKASEQKGVGTKLLEQFEYDLKLNGKDIYGLSVKKNNINAIKFYLKNNFKVEREEKNAIYYIKEVNKN